MIDVKKAFTSARLEAGIPDFQLRDLRHSCATRLSDKGEELVTVAEILGHTDDEEILSRHARTKTTKRVKNEKRQGARPAVSN